MINVIIEEKLYDAEFVDKHTHGFAELAAHAAGYPPERVAAITWLEPEQIRQAARLYAQAKPAALAWGNPIEHTSNAFHAARGLVCLMALSGNLDVAGGNIYPLEPKIAGLGSYVRADLVPNKPQGNAQRGPWGDPPLHDHTLRPFCAGPSWRVTPTR